MLSSPDEGIMFMGSPSSAFVCLSVHSFITMISHERLEQFW